MINYKALAFAHAERSLREGLDAVELGVEFSIALHVYKEDPCVNTAKDLVDALVEKHNLAKPKTEEVSTGTTPLSGRLRAYLVNGVRINAEGFEQAKDEYIEKYLHEDATSVLLTVENENGQHMLFRVTKTPNG